jgi:hypothetical protein
VGLYCSIYARIAFAKAGVGFQDTLFCVMWFPSRVPRKLSFAQPDLQRWAGLFEAMALSETRQETGPRQEPGIAELGDVGLLTSTFLVEHIVSKDLDMATD